MRRKKMRQACTVYQDMKIHFNTAYCIAKEELPFIKFKAMLDLQRTNELTINHTYESDVKCSEVI